MHDSQQRVKTPSINFAMQEALYVEEGKEVEEA
jgi:hypothetical protein